MRTLISRLAGCPKRIVVQEKNHLLGICWNRVIRVLLPLIDFPWPSCFWEGTLGLWALLILSVWKAWTQKHICKVLWVLQTKVKNMFLCPLPPASPDRSEYLKGKRSRSKYHRCSILMGSSWEKMTHIKPQECRASVWMFFHSRNGICCWALSLLHLLPPMEVFCGVGAWLGLCRTHHWTIYFDLVHFVKHKRGKEWVKWTS